MTSMLAMEKDPGWQFLRLSREKMLQEQSRPYDSKKNVWIADVEEGYVPAEVVSTSGDNVTITVKGTEKTVKKDLIQEMNPPKFEKTEDMSNLTFLNDASVLHNLRSRYGAMLIYTYSGLFCVVINPYKRLPIYTDSVARMFMGKRRSEMPPHLFAVSDEAYRSMLQNRENQSMLITGESGAGKTENTKKVIAYFASVGASQQEKSDSAPVAKGKTVTLEDQIVQTNPVLEAFGNAKTVRNNNSSRFGKFIRIHFNKAGRVASCDIEHYLLEKSRVIRQAPGERCYHIFYQIFSGYNPTLKSKLKLTKPLTDYWFVSQAELTIDGVDDKEEFKLTDEAFDVLNFNAEEKMDCYRLMSGIMHMGNMKFKQRPREEQAEPDETEEAQCAADMFSIDADALVNALVKPRVRVGNEWVSKGQNVDQVTWSIGAMAKALFARVFDWLVKKCNMTLDQKGLSRDYFIGVLDIAGFEIFDLNSFEQLWINFVNEKLQQFFNHHMFVLEQEEYAREGIQWTFIDFGLDLQACIELIEKPMGIISMLDEECIVPKATDMTLAQKLIEQHVGKHPNFEKAKPPKGKQAEAHFAMRHYAGTVRYNVLNWLEKNKDPLNDTLVNVMKSAKGNALLLEVWSNYQTQEEAVGAGKGSGGKKKGKSGSFMTVSMLYRESLNKLMTMLNGTHPHFIRCIIPNEKKASGVIDAALVLNQLTCNGVLEGIRICRKGFPNRMTHSDFKTRYSILAAEAARSSTDAKVAVGAVLDVLVGRKDLQDDQFRVGHTKVFFKAGVLASIEELRDKRQAILMTGLQAAARQYLAKKDALRRRRALDAYGIIQRNIRSWCTLRSWDWYLLYGRVKPMFKLNKHEEEMERLEAELKTLETDFAKEEEQRRAAESEHAAVASRRDELLAALEEIRSHETASEGQISEMNASKQELERRLNDLKDQLSEQEQRADEAQRQVRRAEKERDAGEEQIAQLEESLARVDEERHAVETRMREMNDSIVAQDEAIAAANREKKRVDEENRKLAESLEAETERNSQSGRVKTKLERAIEEVESSLERERRHRAEAEKARKRLESEVMAIHEQIDEVQKLKAETEARHQRVDAELRDAIARLDDQSGIGAKQQHQLRDNADRIAEMEEELEAERHARAKADKSRSALQAQLDSLNDAIDESGYKTSEMVEAGKKKDVELARLRQELQAQNQRMETELAALKKRYADETAELAERLETLQTTKAKTNKELETVRRSLDDVLAQVAEETKARSEGERYLRSAEAQLAELQAKCDEQYKLVQELTATNSQLQMHGVEMEQKVEEFEARLTQAGKAKTQAEAQLEDVRQTLHEERQERQELNGVVKALEHDIEQIREAIDEEALQKEDILKQISRAKAEAQQWKAKFDGEGLITVDELEEERRRRAAKRAEIEDALAATLTKIANCEKANSKLLADEEEARAEAERNRMLITQLEQKQANYEKGVEEWRRQCDELAAEIERVQGESRRQSTAVHTLQTALNALNERADELRRDNKALVAELRDTREQLATSMRIAHDTAKKVKMLELEQEEIQHALDEAESALEIEEGKVLRVQSEVAHIRADIDRRIAEKEEDFESTLKNHQRAVDSIRASLDSELKGRAALAQQKQTLENDLNDLELSLDMANKSNVDAQKQLKKYQMQIQDLQAQVEEEQRRREEFREQFLTTEHQLNVVNAERQELETQRDQLDAHKARTEAELADQRARHNELQAQNLAYSSDRRAVENDVNMAKAELDKTLAELRQVEENFKKVNADVARLTTELSQEQQHHEYLERLRRGHELQIKELQARLEQSEQQAARHGQRAVDKLQECIRTREQEMEIEQRRHKDVVKQLNKCERDVRERAFELEEHKKSSTKMQELIEKLQSKLKVHKKQLEEAEEVAAMNQQKFRQIQTSLENTEERADEAENSLLREKSRMRNMTAVGGLANGGSGRLAHSATAMGGLRGLVSSTALANSGTENGLTSHHHSPLSTSGVYQRSSSGIFSTRSRIPRTSSYANFK